MVHITNPSYRTTNSQDILRIHMNYSWKINLAGKLCIHFMRDQNRAYRFCGKLCICLWSFGGSGSLCRLGKKFLLGMFSKEGGRVSILVLVLLLKGNGLSGIPVHSFLHIGRNSLHRSCIVFHYRLGSCPRSECTLSFTHAHHTQNADTL